MSAERVNSGDTKTSGVIMGLSEFTSIATVAGIFIAAWQLYLTQRQAAISFEDSLAYEYRRLASTIPTSAFLGEEFDDQVMAEHIDEFYHYFDLCNSQIFMRQHGRISKKTWLFWQEGIATNLARPSFKKAWAYVSQRSGSDFSELKRLAKGNYMEDPRKWTS